MPRQIVTLQLGTYANHIGAHFWNLQDEYLSIPPDSRELSPSVLFREASESAVRRGRAPLYAPRLQIVDATSAFGALNVSSGIVLSDADFAALQKPAPASSSTADDDANAPENDQPLWHGREERYVQERITPSPYITQLQAEEQREPEHLDTNTAAAATPQATSPSETTPQRTLYWSDHLKTRLHPRTCFPLPGVHHNVTPLPLFENGTALATTILLEDLYNDLRFFIEECDTFGGITLLANPDDAYAGLTARYFAHIRDELGSASPLLLFGAHNNVRQYTHPTTPLYDPDRPFDAPFEASCTHNEAQLAAVCHQFSAQYIPLSARHVRYIPHVHVDPRSTFHNSAVLALALDVAQTPLRHRMSLSEMLGALRPLPFATFSSIGCNFPPTGWKPTYSRGLFSVDGTLNLSRIWNVAPEAKDSGMSAVVHSPQVTHTEVVSARGLKYQLPVASNVSAPVTLPIPFPHIFDSTLDRDVRMPHRTDPNQVDQPVELDEISLLAGLATVPTDAQTTLSVLGKAVRDYSRSDITQSTGADPEELREASELLTSCAEDYSSL